MRKRARVARAGRWEVGGSADSSAPVVARWTFDERPIASCSGALPDGNSANAAHIASWDTAVAFAVADLLDRAADDHDETPCPAVDAALAVADAYLRTEASNDV